jgi:hypothetical protein
MYTINAQYLEKQGAGIMGKKVIHPNFSFGVQIDDMRFRQEPEGSCNSNIFSATMLTVARCSGRQSRR